MSLRNQPKYAQHRPQQKKLISKLLKTGLFSKVGSAFKTNNLKLNDTRYFVVVVSNNIGHEKMRWFYVPEGVSTDELSFYSPRITGAIPRENAFIKELSLETIFEEAPKEIVTKLLFHLGTVPK